MSDRGRERSASVGSDDHATLSIDSGMIADDTTLLAASTGARPVGTASVPDSPEQAALNKRRFLEGIVLLVAVNIIWVAASVLVQYIYNDLGFRQPFFVTYVSNSLFIVYLGGVPVYRALSRWYTAGGDAMCVMLTTDPMRRCSPGHEGDLPVKHTGEPARAAPFTVKKTALVALYICPVWFTAQCTYNASLDWTSVSSSTILSTVSGLFTFLLCLIFLGEHFKWLKLVGVVSTIVGAVFVALSDERTEDAGKDTIGGDFIALFSALCYATYTTMIRVFIPDEHATSMPLFFGFVGLFNCIILLPVLLVLNWTGVESMEGLTFGTFCFIVLKGLVDNVLSDLLWARAVLLTSPTIATIGLTLTIPLSMLSDWLFKALVPAPLLVLGSVAVTLGFIAVNLGGQLKAGEEEVGGWRKRCSRFLAICLKRA